MTASVETDWKGTAVPRRVAAILATLAILAAMQPLAAQDGAGHRLVLVAGPTAPAKEPAPLSPEARMQRRYPQPVKVGDLIGLPVLDFDDRTLGRVQSVVRTPAGKILLIVPYGGFLGWRRRLVAVPVETVAIGGRQLAALDMTRAEFDAAPAWNDPQSRSLPASEIVRVGLYRR